jgi:hypothetical protein
MPGGIDVKLVEKDVFVQISEVNKAVIYISSVQRLPELLKEKMESRVHNIFEFPWEAFVLGNF